MYRSKDAEQLRLILLNSSCKTGEFLLVSGKKSDFYADCMPTTMSPEGLYLCGKVLYHSIWNEDAIAIGGLELGAVPLVSATVMYSNMIGDPLHGFVIRKKKKDYGTSVNIEGTENIPKGSKVIIVEDVVTLGGSILKGIKAAEQAGYVVTSVITLIDRQEGGSEMLEDKGYKLRSIFKREDFI